MPKYFANVDQLTADVDKSKIDFPNKFTFLLILNISFNILASVGHFFVKYDNKMCVWKLFVFSVRAPKRKYFKIFGGKRKPAKTLATLRPSFSTFRCSTRIPYGKFSVNCRLYEGRLTKKFEKPRIEISWNLTWRQETWVEYLHWPMVQFQ